METDVKDYWLRYQMPKFDPKIPFVAAQGRHHRRSIRLPEYDYTQAGAYYITIVTYNPNSCLAKWLMGK